MKIQKDRLIKYLLMVFILVLSLKYVPSHSLCNKEIFIITTIGIVAFTILDYYYPTIRELNSN